MLLRAVLGLVALWYISKPRGAPAALPQQAWLRSALASQDQATPMRI
jgi:hypothetical protein